MTEIIYRNIDDDYFNSELAATQRRESDKFGELLQRSGNKNSSGTDDTIDNLIKAAMPLANGDSMADSCELSCKSKSENSFQASPDGSKSLQEIQLNIAAREYPFINVKDPDQ